MILAIDPGNIESAWLVYDDVNTKKPIAFAKESNKCVLTLLREGSVGKGQFAKCEVLACEMIASYGMPVGKEVFDTCVWAGRFVEAWRKEWNFVYRKDVKLHVCNSPRANDANIRAALIDRFGKPGTKKNPGATFGITKDIWAALAVAVTYVESTNVQKTECS